MKGGGREEGGKGKGGHPSGMSILRNHHVPCHFFL